MKIVNREVEQVVFYDEQTSEVLAVVSDNEVIEKDGFKVRIDYKD